jgi:hypothetical protein
MFLLRVLITYVVIGLLQLIINTLATDSEIALLVTCFWMIPGLILINKIRKENERKKWIKENDAINKQRDSKSK